MRTPLSPQGDDLTPVAAAVAVLPVLTPRRRGSRNPQERSPIPSPPLRLSPRGAFRDPGPLPAPGGRSRVERRRSPWRAASLPGQVGERIVKAGSHRRWGGVSLLCPRTGAGAGRQRLHEAAPRWVGSPRASAWLLPLVRLARGEGGALGWAPYQPHSLDGAAGTPS